MGNFSGGPQQGIEKRLDQTNKLLTRVIDQRGGHLFLGTDENIERFEILFRQINDAIKHEFEEVDKLDPNRDKKNISRDFKELYKVCSLLLSKIPDKETNHNVNTFRENVLSMKDTVQIGEIELDVRNRETWIGFDIIRETLLKLELDFPVVKTLLLQTKKKTTNAYLDQFEFLQIHPEIKKVSEKLFEDGYYSQAIFEAFKRVNNGVKEKSGLNNDDGKSLMHKAFSPNKPILKFNESRNQSEKDEQEGLMHLFVGASQGIRNPKAHETISQTDPIRTLEYLAFASLLYRRLDESQRAGQEIKY